MSAAASTETAAAPVSWLTIGTLIVVLGSFALNSGFVFPANSLAMTGLGYSAAYVGALGSAGAVGYILGSLVAPFIATAIGLRTTIAAAVVLVGLIIVGFAVIPAMPAWYPMRVLHGIATTTFYVCGESALIALAPAAMRGRVIGFYTAYNSVFFTAGPLVVAHVGFEGLLPYLLVGGAVALLAAPILVFGRATPELPMVPVREMLRSVASIPLLLIVIFAWGWIDGAQLNLLSVYAVRRGDAAEHAATFISILSVGNIVLQFPIGWIADLVPRRIVLAGLSAFGAIACLAIPFVDLGGTQMLALLVFMGAVGFGTFTVSLIALGEVLTGAELVAASAAFGLLWGVGDFLGAFTTGWLMDAVGAEAFPVALAAGFAVQCAAAVLLPLRLGQVSGRS